MSLLLVVVVHSVDDVLLPVLHNLPDGPADHVTGWDGSHRQSLHFPLQVDGLVVFELSHLLKTQINLVQAELVKVLNTVSGLQQKVVRIFLLKIISTEVNL